jgi:TolB-like protein/cytochrome c-type biogenesis protein CcmH/NrfG
MSSESPSELKFDIGHVLFIDIVGYSKLLIAEQSDQIQTLREIVRGTEQFKKADAEGKLLRLPTGDGGALVFRNSLEAPVLCALEISKALKSHPEIKVRMGIHSGPVNEITDLNEQANIAGVGINMAQRVMDCGDAGHILLSKRVADDLEQYPQWRSRLSDLGECEVKHGARVSVVNLYTDDAGNREPPQKFAKQSSLPAAIPASSPRGRSKLTTTAGAALVLLIVGGALWFLSRQKGSHSSSSTSSSSSAVATIPEKSIAVLPFESLSEDKANAYFAEGIQDEILTKLASIADLKVISRTSTEKYTSKPEDLKTVSQQLGVAHVLEGTVQRAAEKVRVNVQLIDARADNHLWAKSYDREVKDIFAVESEISQEVADALQAKLSPNETNTLSTAPTSDAEAYDFFLKGEFEEREAESSTKPEVYDQAINWYRQAIARDPNFALAIARLVNCRMQRHWFVEQLSESDLEQVAAMAERALAISPKLAEAHVARGIVYYFGHRAYDQALTEFRQALELQPNNVNALQYIGYVHRRQGQWKACLSELLKSQEQNPRDAALTANIARTYCHLRMWNEGERQGTLSLSLNPHTVDAMYAVLLTYLNGKGDLKGARRALETFPADANLVQDAGHNMAEGLIGGRAYVSVMEKNFGAALQLFDKGKSNLGEGARLSARAMIHVLAGDAGAATTESEEGRTVIEMRLRERPHDLDATIQLSWVNLALNRQSEAVEAAQKAVDLLPLENDALVGTYLLFNLAVIEAHTGRTTEAIDLLRRLLSIPAGQVATVARLKIDPIWDPIRNEPGFQQLLAGRELVGPNK